MNILMIGDISGKPGRILIRELLPGLKREFKVDFVIANGENAASGSGITRETANELFLNGVDILTMGNHTWDKKEIFHFIDQDERIVRPLNYPPGTPGQGSVIVDLFGHRIGIINLLGRAFLPPIDCPFRTIDHELEKMKKETNIILIDFHAETTSEKVALGWYLDGRVSAVAGTHTHIQTADETVLPQGTAYITDLGMTGSYNSVLGVKKELVIEKFLTNLPVKFEIAKGQEMLCGLVVTLDENSGKALTVRRIRRALSSL